MDKLELYSFCSLSLYFMISIILVIIWQHIWKKEKNDFGLLFMASAIMVWAVVALVDFLYFNEHSFFSQFSIFFGTEVAEKDVFVFLRRALSGINNLLILISITYVGRLLYDRTTGKKMILGAFVVSTIMVASALAALYKGDTNGIKWLDIFYSSVTLAILLYVVNKELIRRKAIPMVIFSGFVSLCLLYYLVYFPDLENSGDLMNRMDFDLDIWLSVALLSKVGLSLVIMSLSITWAIKVEQEGTTKNQLRNVSFAKENGNYKMTIGIPDLEIEDKVIVWRELRLGIIYLIIFLSAKQNDCTIEVDRTGGLTSDDIGKYKREIRKMLKSEGIDISTKSLFNIPDKGIHEINFPKDKIKIDGILLQDEKIISFLDSNQKINNILNN